MTNIEVKNQWFFPAKLRDKNGTFLRVPDEARKKCKDLKEQRQSSEQDSPHEASHVFIYPSGDPENQGWFVCREISSTVNPHLPDSDTQSERKVVKSS